LKSGSLNLLEPSGPAKACNETALPLPCELFLLAYVILQMGQRKKWDPKRMKAAIEAMRNKEMGIQ
jgi:hypothetical protein